MHEIILLQQFKDASAPHYGKKKDKMLKKFAQSYDNYNFFKILPMKIHKDLKI